MPDETRVFVNSKMEIIVKAPPTRQLTAEEEAERLIEIPIVNEKLEGPKSVFPKPLASYLLKKTELTEEALNQAQTAPYRFDDVILVRCRFEKDEKYGSMKDIVIACPGNARVNNVEEVLRASLGADRAFVIFKIYLDTKRNNLLDGMQDVRSLASKNKESPEVVFFVKFEPSDLWKESFVMEEVRKESNEEEKEDTSDKNIPSTSSSLPPAVASTSQESHTVPVTEKQDNGEEENDEMPKLDMETPCEEPEIEPSTSPQIVQSEARVVYVERSPSYMRPTSTQSIPIIHRPNQPQTTKNEGVDLKPQYAIFSMKDQEEILRFVGHATAIPENNNIMLFDKFYSHVSPQQVADYLRISIAMHEEFISKMSSETPSYESKQAECSRLKSLLEKFCTSVNKAAEESNKRKQSQQQRHTQKIRQNHLTSSAHCQPTGTNPRYTLGSPVNLSQLNLCSLKPVGKLNVNQAPPSTQLIRVPNQHEMMQWNFPPSDTPTELNKDNTIKAIHEYAKLARDHNIAAQEFLKSYTSSERMPEKGTILTKRQFDNFFSRRNCNQRNVIIPKLNGQLQEDLYHSILNRNESPLSMARVYSILGWEQNTQKRPLDIGYSATRSIVPPKIRKVSGISGASPTSSESSFASNISSPESMEQRTNL